MSARSLALVFAVGLGVRFLVFFELRDSVLLEVLLGDSLGYVEWAREISGGAWRGNEVFYQAPLYPYFIAVVFAASDGSLMAVRVLQLLLGSAACVLITLATARFFARTGFAQQAALAAGLLLALYPVAVFFDTIIQKTSVASFLMALLLYLVSRFDEVDVVRWPLAAGGVLGALILTRENALIFFPVIGLWCVLPVLTGNAGERALRLGLFAVGTAMILLPIGARNLSLGDEFLITTSQLGPNLYIGNNPEADGRYRALLPDRGDVRHERHDARRLAEHATGQSLSPAEVSDYWASRVFDFMRGEPAAWLRLNLHKLWMVFNAEEIADTESLDSYRVESFGLNALGWLYHFGVLFPLAVIGMVKTRKHWRELAVLHAMALAMALGVAAFFVMSRYRFPLVAILVMFAGVGVASLWRAMREDGLSGVWGSRESKQALVTGLVVAVLCNLPVGLAQEPRALTQFNVAMAMLQRERFEDAQRYLERAAEVSVEPVVHLQLGAVLEHRGALARAVDHYETMLADRRADPAELKRRLAALHRRQGDEERAKQIEGEAP
ncbi:MAG: glycosyltransferase family 39 protein [Myxococcota bacterium]|jgi:tetratricopeptide (TPR) repeat protein|nr:glycosyltransferase family 39 protein [Myxococcota bacterium]